MSRNGIITDIDYKKTSSKVIYWSIIAILCLVAVVCIFPVAWVLLSSLKSVDEFYSVPPTLWPKSFHFELIPEMLGKYNFARLYGNTICVCVGQIMFSIVFNGMLGYVLSKMKVKGRKLIFGLVFSTYLLPTTVSMVPIYKNIVEFPLLNINLINTYWPMWLMAGANAFYVIIYKSFFDGIPTELLEAGKLDGCNDFTSFTKIILPLSKPIISTMIILSFNGAWGDFFWPYMVLKDLNMQTIMVNIYKMQQSTTVQINTLLLAIAFAIISPIIVFIFFQKKIMNGFTMSGIKG